MIFYKLDHVIEETLKAQPSREQKFLAEYTGRTFPKTEAGHLWERITDHKWYVSERLGRDIGLRVAAVDYLENFYETPLKKSRRNRSSLIRKNSPAINSLA